MIVATAGSELALAVTVEPDGAADYRVTWRHVPLPGVGADDPAERQLEPGDSKRGDVGFAHDDEEDDWSFVAPSDGIVQIKLRNSLSGSLLDAPHLSVRLLVENSELWSMDTQPTQEPRASGMYLARQDEEFSIFVRLKSGEAATYQLELYWTPLSAPTPVSDEDGATIELGETRAARVGFSAEDSTDTWEFIPPHDGTWAVVVANTLPPRTQRAEIGIIRFRSGSSSASTRGTALPNQQRKTSALSARAGERCLVNVSPTFGHAATYTVRVFEQP